MARKKAALGSYTEDETDFDEKPPSRTGYFWWSVLIILLTGACFASWIGCFYVVAHPEDPRCYRFLKKIKRVDPPKRFRVGHGDTDMAEVPHGDFLTVAKLLERYGKVGPEELAQENARLLRNYLMNFHEAKKRNVTINGKVVAQQDVVYVIGRFDVVGSHVLGPTDLFPSGVVAVAQSLEAPQVLIETIFCTDPKVAPGLHAALPTGSNLKLERSLDLLAIIHVERVADGHLQFTVIPLPYTSWQNKHRDQTFRLRSPEELEKVDPRNTINLAAGLPVVRGDRLQKGLSGYLEYRRKLLASGVEEETWEPDLVRFDSDRDDSDADSNSKKADSTASPALSAPAGTKSEDVDTELPTPATPGAKHNAAPPVTTVIGHNPIPRRVFSVKEAAGLANSPSPIPASVLSGDFLVSGLEGRRAQMRAPIEAGSKPALILVDFPPGTKLPNPGSSLRREGSHGFVLKKVERTTAGQITIEAEEQTP